MCSSDLEVINAEQKKALEDYVKKGGCLIGIHGSGDNSHHWDWYVKSLLGAEFSHHPLDPQIQEATVTLEAVADINYPLSISTPMSGMSFLKIRKTRALKSFIISMVKALIRVAICFG